MPRSKTTKWNEKIFLVIFLFLVSSKQGIWVGGNIETKLNGVQERLITIKCCKIKINIVWSIRIK
jgi:hypothetical protein